MVYSVDAVGMCNTSSSRDDAEGETFTCDKNIHVKT